MQPEPDNNPKNDDDCRGFWNGLPTKVRHVIGTVRQHDPEKDPPQAWWAGIPISDEHRATMEAFGMTASPSENLQGQRVAAVEVVLDGVNFGGGTIYLDNRDGSGWYKVTEGRGSPRIGHAELPLIDVETQPWCPTSLTGHPNGCRCRP